MKNSPIVYIENDGNAVARRLVEIFSDVCRKSVASTGRFRVALSGGATPRPFYRRLAVSGASAGVLWNKTHVFWADERCVAESDPASNYGSVRRDMLQHVPVPDHQIHPMKGGLPPEAGALDYQAVLMREMPPERGRLPVFDLVLLGVGTDGHVASLFPGLAPGPNEKRWVVALKGGSPDVHRLTLTLPVINHGKHVVFMVSGTAKADIVKTLFSDAPPELPARQVDPENGASIWVMDRAAASKMA